MAFLSDKQGVDAKSACGLAPPGGDPGEGGFRRPLPFTTMVSRQSKRGCSRWCPLVMILWNTCVGGAEGRPWGPLGLQTQPRGHRPHAPRGPLTTMSRSAWVPVKTGMSMGTRTE